MNLISSAATSLCLLICGTVPAWAIPETLSSSPPAALGEGIDLSPEALFTQSGKSAPAEPRPAPALSQTAPFTPWSSDTNSFKALGRYSDRSAGTDIPLPDETKVSTSQPVGKRTDSEEYTDPFVADLRPPPTNSIAEAEALRRAIKDAAAKASADPSQEVHGWRDALLCLAGITMVAVVLVARR